MKTPLVAIVVPTLNEEGAIGEFLRLLLIVTTAEKKFRWHLVVVDSQSADRTTEIIDAFKRRHKDFLTLISAPRGLGRSLFLGLDFCCFKLKADYAITLEADLSNDPKQLPEFITPLTTADLVVGSRYTAGGRIEHWSFWRKFLSFSANLTLRLLVGGKIKEYTNLYRSLRLTSWRKLRLGLVNTTDWLFVPALVFEAIRLKLRISEIPITYADRRAGQSKMDTPSYTKSLLLAAIRFRMNKHGTFS